MQYALWIERITYTLYLVLVKVRDVSDDHPGQTSTKVEDLVHSKGHDTSRKDVILHVGIPSSPQLFEDIQVDIVF